MRWAARFSILILLAGCAASGSNTEPTPVPDCVTAEEASGAFGGLGLPICKEKDGGCGGTGCPVPAKEKTPSEEPQ